MSFQVNIPPSVMAKMAKSAEGEEDIAEKEENTRKKREDWKKLKELEEMRKAGTAPAMQDEEGKDINPHIPQYIMQAPWYFGTTAPTLNHQRTQPEKQKEFASPEQWYKRGVKEGPIATKFRKGACGNCGAMTHKQRDCLERPRKVGAKFTGTEIAPDEFIQPQLSHDYDGKRDRWNGYDTDEHKRIIDEFQKVEEAKKLLKAQKLESSIDTGEEEKQEVLGDVDGDDEDKYADDVEMPGQRMDTKQRITVRNLRIREDTAKYLYNLELNSAHYDPKTRSMRENPFEKLGKEEKELPFAGDNFVRYSGDAHQMSKRQMFAWQAYEKGTDTHLQADPTKLEMLATEFKKRKEDYKSNMKNSILEKYGGEEHLEGPAKELLLAQTEDYVEYSRHGTVIKGQEKAKIKSRFEEDVYISNHTSVWGSYWKAGQWGFHCCHSLIKESYCTGTAGRAAQQTSIPALAQETEEPPKSLVEQHQAKMAQESKKAKKKKDKKKKKKRRRKTKKRKKVESSSESSSDSDSSDDSSSSESEDEDAEREKRVKKAIKVEEERIKRVNKILKMDERKRPYNSMYNEAEPTEEELEAFRRKQHNPDDPMAQFLK